MDTYGVSFSPTASLDKSQKPTDPNTNVQEAIRTLALRIPKVTGAKGFAPDALMGGMGSQAAPQGMLGLDRLLAAIFGNQAQGAPQGAGMLGGGSAPAPRVTGLETEQAAPSLMDSGPAQMPSMPDAPMAPTYNKRILGDKSTDY